MAELEKDRVILRVGTEDAVKNVGDLKNNIKELKKQIEGWVETTEEGGKKVKKVHEGLTIGTDEYKDAIKQLHENQKALRDAMYATSASMEDVAASAKGLDVEFDKNNDLINAQAVSYNALVNKMSQLKEEWRSTTDQAKRADLGEQINQINDRLKELDKSVGSHVRNVGNYASALDGLSKGFNATAGGAAGLLNPLQRATMGFQALSATPVVSILGLLANIISKVIENLDSSAETSNRMTKSLAVFGGVADGITKILQALGSGVAWVTEKMADLYTKIFGVTDAMKERQRIAEEQVKLEEQERKSLMDAADAQLRIAELKAKSSEKDKYTAQERLKFLEESGELEKQIADQAYQDLKNQYEIIKAKNALTESSAEDLQKEAEAYAAMVKAQTDYFNKVKEVNSQMVSARNEEKKAAKEAAKEAQDALKARISAEKDLIDQELELTQRGSDEQLRLQIERRDKEYKLAIAEAKTKIKDANSLHKTLILLEKKYNKDIELLQRDHQKEVESQHNLHLQNLADIYEQGTINYLTAIRDLRKQELDQIQREEGETIDEYNARRIKAQKAYNDAVRAINEKNVKDSTAELRLALASQAEGTEGYYVGMMSLAENYWKTLSKNAGESDTEFAIRQAEAFKAYQDAVNEYLDYGEQQERLSMENRMNAFQEGSIEYLDAAIELKKFELDTLHQLEGESNEEFRARELEAQKAYDDAIKASFEGRISMMQNYAGTLSAVMGSLADLYESDAKNTQKSAKKVKALRIAQATIDTISGAVGAFTSAAANPGGVPGMVLGAANAAAVTATGLANIAKIKSTDISTSGGSSIGASVSAPSVGTEISQVRNVTSASEEERLNQIASDQRVKLVMSDLEVAEGQIRVQTEESSF